MKTLVFSAALGLLPGLAAAQTPAGARTDAVAEPVPAGVIPLSDLGKPLLGTGGAATDQVQSQRYELKRMPLVHKYVNYEALKVMLGVGWGAHRPFGRLVSTDTEQAVQQDNRFSGRVQLLYPRPLLRTSFPIAFGVTYTWNVIAIRQARFVLEDPAAGQLFEVPSVRYSRLRTQGLGVVALRVIRLPGTLHAMTLMVGAAGEYNLSSRLRTRLVEGTDQVRYSRGLRAHVHRWSVPAQVQLGWSRSQFFSVGAYAAYDFVPRFRAERLSQVHQMNIGLSAGLII